MAGPYVPSDSRNYVGVGKQSSRGSGIAPTAFIGYEPSVTLDHSQQLKRIYEAGASGEVTTTEKDSHIPKGTIPFLARPSITARLMAYIMGPGSDSAGAPVNGVTPHTLTDKLPTQYVSLEQYLAPDIVERFVDAALFKMVISWDVSSPYLQVTVDWMGGKPSVQGAPTSTSYDADRPFLVSDASFTVDGNPVTNVRKGSLTYEVKTSPEQIIDVATDYLVQVGDEVTLEVEHLVTDVNQEYRYVNYGGVGATTYQKLPTTGAFVGDWNYGSAGGARELKLEVLNLDWDEAIYTPLNPNTNEATKVNRKATGRVVSGTPLFRYTGKNTDSSTYT